VNWTSHGGSKVAPNSILFDVGTNNTQSLKSTSWIANSHTGDMRRCLKKEADGIGNYPLTRKESNIVTTF